MLQLDGNIGQWKTIWNVQQFFSQNLFYSWFLLQVLVYSVLCISLLTFEPISTKAVTKVPLAEWKDSFLLLEKKSSWTTVDIFYQVNDFAIYYPHKIWKTWINIFLPRLVKRGSPVSVSQGFILLYWTLLPGQT